MADATTTETAAPSPESSGKGGIKPWVMPDTLLLLFFLAVIAWGATFIFTPGAFSVDGEPARIVPGSFVPADAPAPAPILGDAERTGFLDFLFAGLVTGDRYSPTVGLMAFILVLGGVFGMITRTRAVDAALAAALPDGKARGETLVVTLFLAFSLAGAVFGMAEEAIALTLVLTPALNRAGYNPMTALLVCFGATQIGFATSWMNPFSVIIAQSIAGLPPLSGMGLRIAMWTGFTLLAAAYVWRYARRIRLSNLAKPANNPGSDVDEDAENDIPPYQLAHGLIIAGLVAVIAWIAWGVSAKGYYLAEIAAQFFTLGIAVVVVGKVAKLPGCDLNSMMDGFNQGAAGLLPAALIVGAAKGIILLLGGDDPTAASLLNSLLNSMSGLTASAPDWLTAWVMYAAQSIINLFITSGSGQASVTMPIMAPLADLSGVTRQTAVLAFQLGDGITNLIVPTSAVLMGCLAAAKVSYLEWMAFIWKPMVVLIALASVMVLAAHGAGY
ncbi:MAG: putative basic amino acid antiporter YfcC [Pseudomonadota bacterium]